MAKKGSPTNKAVFCCYYNYYYYIAHTTILHALRRAVKSIGRYAAQIKSDIFITFILL